MVCPKCKLDYNDVENDEVPVKIVIKIDDHFYKQYRRLARRCPHCAFVAEWIEKPTGEPYFKRMPVAIPAQRKQNKKKQVKVRR